MQNYTIEDLFAETDVALANKNWTIATSSCPRLFDKSFFLDLLLPWPFDAVLAIGKLINKKKKEKMAKELAYQKAIAKQNAIINALKNEVNADSERIASLTRLNSIYTELIKKMSEETASKG